MTKADAWDIIERASNDGVNCWEISDDKDMRLNFAYLTGMIDALGEAVEKDEKHE